MELNDILEGSDPDGKPKPDPVERQIQAERKDAAPEPKPEPKTEKADADLAPDGNQRTSAVKSRRKQLQAKEMEARGINREGGDQPRDETGKFASTEEANPEGEAKPAEPENTATQKPEEKKENQEFTEKERAFLAAMQEERRKRQAMEQELNTIRQQAMQTAQQNGGQPPKTFWDDPEAALKQFQQQVQTVALRTRLDTSEAIARQRYQDFEQNVQFFGELMAQTPGLREQMLNSPDPAEFAYKTGKTHREYRELGSIEEYRAKVEREARAKIEAEYKQREQERQQKTAELPTSLTNAPSRPAPNRAVYNGPTSLESLLSGR